MHLRSRIEFFYSLVRHHRLASFLSPKHNPRMNSSSPSRTEPARLRTHRLQVVMLLLLAPIGAEYLSAYDDSTGDVVALLFGLLFFIPLYGAPALLIREVARRAELGWTGIILMATAFGLLQAGVVDQSLFSESYRDIESWADSLRGSYVEPLGISLYNAVNFIGGHMIYSIGAPIAIAEALRPQSAHEPWLGKVGLGITSVLYILISLVILADHLENEVSHASAPQVVVSLVIVMLLIAAAFRFGRQSKPRAGSATPTVRRTFAVSIVLIAAYSLGPEGWSGALLATGSLLVAAVLLRRASRGALWSLGHTVSIATAVLLARAAFAFLYFPVIGEVSLMNKYGHNLVMLVIVSVACYMAWRATRAFGAPVPIN